MPNFAPAVWRFIVRGIVLGTLLCVMACAGVPRSVGTADERETPTVPPPTETPAPSPTIVPTATPMPPTPTPVPPSPTPSSFVVGNTGGDGVYVRRTAGGNDKIKAWPDGTAIVT